MTISEGPLTWPLAAGVASFPEGLDSALQALATSIATEWLWGLTARQFGTFQAIYRPQTRVLSPCFPFDAFTWLQSIFGPSGWPFGADPRYWNLAVKQVCELIAPVVDPSLAGVPYLVDSYPLSGPAEHLSTADATPLFRIVGNYLVRQDGGQWQDTQNGIAKLGDPNTWAVTYQRGAPVPSMGQAAAALLAAEIGKELLGKKSDCRLPQNTTTASRAGVTINRDILTATKTTGVTIADRWVASVNPNGLQQAPQIFSPDLPRNARPFAGSYVPPT